jgi:hypothetical protein
VLVTLAANTRSGRGRIAPDRVATMLQRAGARVEVV